MRARVTYVMRGGSNAAALNFAPQGPRRAPLSTRALALASWQRLRGHRLLRSHDRGRKERRHPPTRPDCTKGGHHGILEIESASADTWNLSQSASAPALRPTLPLLEGRTCATAAGAAGVNTMHRAHRTRVCRSHPGATSSVMLGPVGGGGGGWRLLKARITFDGARIALGGRDRGHWRSSASLICRFSRTASEPSLSRQVTRLRACARAAVRARARGLRTWCKLTCRWGSVRYRNSKAEVMPTSMRVEGSVTCPHLCKWAGLCLEYCLGDL